MPKMTFVTANDARVTCEVPVGESVMQAARTNNVVGISGECGGEMMCATCHCYVAKDWLDQTGRASEGEAEMLEFAACDVNETSRLSCQIKMSDALDGLVIYLPDSQV